MTPRYRVRVVERATLDAVEVEFLNRGWLREETIVDDLVEVAEQERTRHRLPICTRTRALPAWRVKDVEEVRDGGA